MLDPPTRALVPATYYGRSNLKLAYASGVFALTYSDEFINGNTNTKLLRFDSNLTKLDAAPLTLLDVSLSDLAGNGTSFYIVWNRQEPNGLVHVVGSRVSTAGVKLDGNGVNISGTKEPGYGSITAVVWDGVNWRVTWSDITTFWIARVNTAGVVLDPGSVAVAGVQTGPTAGNGAGGLQVIWTEFTNNNSRCLHREYFVRQCRRPEPDAVRRCATANAARHRHQRQRLHDGLSQRDFCPRPRPCATARRRRQSVDR